MRDCRIAYDVLVVERAETMMTAVAAYDAVLVEV
jgi:hypothetical protein